MTYLRMLTADVSKMPATSDQNSNKFCFQTTLFFKKRNLHHATLFTNSKVTLKIIRYIYKISKVNNNH